MVLRAGLNRAVRWGIIPASPLRQVSVPRSTARKPRPLTGGEAARFVKAVRGERLEACLLLALMVGLRRGELMGLQWQDVDFAAGRLSVRRQLSRGRGSIGWSFAPLKTGSSERTVNLPAPVLEALRQHRGAQETEALRAGTRGWTDAGLVFCARDGKPLGDGPLTAAWRRALARAGIERRSFHSARHTAATLLMENGVHPKVVQVTLGHARIEQTLNVYTSVSVDAQAAASRAMDRLFCGAGETATGRGGADLRGPT
jgi:integrase